MNYHSECWKPSVNRSMSVRIGSKPDLILLCEHPSVLPLQLSLFDLKGQHTFECRGMSVLALYNDTSETLHLARYVKAQDSGWSYQNLCVRVRDSRGSRRRGGAQSVSHAVPRKDECLQHLITVCCSDNLAVLEDKLSSIVTRSLKLRSPYVSSSHVNAKSRTRSSNYIGITEVRRHHCGKMRYYIHCHFHKSDPQAGYHAAEDQWRDDMINAGYSLD